MLSIDGVDMLDVREAAELAGRTPETVRRWIWAGRLTARRHGNKLLIAHADLEALMSGGSAEPAPSLAAWAERVEQRRRSGTLGPTTRGSSAAQLVLDDRSDRESA